MGAMAVQYSTNFSGSSKRNASDFWTFAQELTDGWHMLATACDHIEYLKSQQISPLFFLSEMKERKEKKIFTPFGNPASVANLARANAVNGVSSAGLITTVQPVKRTQLKNTFPTDFDYYFFCQSPAAIAALAFRVIIACGKFHGVMSAATPIG